MLSFQRGLSETKRGPVRLPGMEAFLPPISCRQGSSLHDLLWVPKGRFKQLLMKGGSATKPPEARLKGQEKLIKIKRPTTWDPAHTLILSATPPFWNFAEERRMQDCHCFDPYRIPLTKTITLLPIPQGGGQSSWGTSLLGSLFAWQRNKATLSFSSRTLSPYFCLALVHREPRFWHHFHSAPLTIAIPLPALSFFITPTCFIFIIYLLFSGIFFFIF